MYSRMSLAEYERRQYASALLGFLEKSGCDPEKLKRLFREEKKNLEKVKEELEEMPEERFRELVSKSRSPFAVASKSFYMSRVEKSLEKLERMKHDAETLLKFLYDNYKDKYDKLAVEYFIKNRMRGYLNRLKQLKKQIRQQRNAALTSFVEEEKKRVAPRRRSRFKVSKKPIAYHDKSEGFIRTIEDRETGKSASIWIRPDPKLWKLDLADPVKSVGRVEIRSGLAPGVAVDVVEPVNMGFMASLVKNGRLKPERIKIEIENLIRTYIDPDLADQVIKWLYKDIPMLNQIDRIFAEKLAELEAEKRRREMPVLPSKPKRKLKKPRKIYKWAGSRKTIERIVKKYGAENVKIVSRVPVGGWLLEITQK